HAVMRPANFDSAVGNLILFVGDEYELLALVGAQGLFGDKQGLVGSADRQTNPREQARGEKTAFVGKDPTDAQGAGRRVDAVVLEVDLTLVRVADLVGQSHENRNRSL